MKLEVPDSLNRNAKSVRDMGTPAETGQMLIDYMCDRIGIENLANEDVLDFGCGVRFSQTIIDLNTPIGSYTGIEVEKRIVDFLQQKVSDPRLSYHLVNTANQLYNPKGAPLDFEALNSLRDSKFDIASMFSVITHQSPQEALPILHFLRRHIKPNGHLFFSAFIHPEEEIQYQELDPNRPGLMSSYSLSYLTELLVESGWSVVSVAERAPNNLPIVDSVLCKPVVDG